MPVVLSEIGTDGTECPDVIGWSNWPGESWVVECKTSRADFLIDRKKDFRIHPQKGLGSFRLFATPPGLIRPSELPPRWGLIEVRPKTVKVVRRPERHELPVWVHMREKRLLMSAIRRATEGWGLAVFGDLRPATPIVPQGPVTQLIKRGPYGDGLPPIDNEGCHGDEDLTTEEA